MISTDYLIELESNESIEDKVKRHWESVSRSADTRGIIQTKDQTRNSESVFIESTFPQKINDPPSHCGEFEAGASSR